LTSPRHQPGNTTRAVRSGTCSFPRSQSTVINAATVIFITTTWGRIALFAAIWSATRRSAGSASWPVTRTTNPSPEPLRDSEISEADLLFIASAPWKLQWDRKSECTRPLRTGGLHVYGAPAETV